MGEDAIKQLLPHAKSEDLRHTLEVCKNTHATLGDETHALLISYGADTKDPHPIVRAMSSMKICGTMLMKESDKSIAHLMTDGCDMGIKSLSSYLNKYKNADSGAKNIAKRFDIDPRRTASLLDITSCTIQGLIPYGAQLLMAGGIAGISALSILPYLYYPMLIGVTVLATILLPKLRKQ